MKVQLYAYIHVCSDTRASIPIYVNKYVYTYIYASLDDATVLYAYNVQRSDKIDRCFCYCSRAHSFILQIKRSK